MAASDEPYDEVKTEVPVETSSWRPTEAAMLPAAGLERPHRTGDWFKVMLGLLGRRAPASPA